MPDEHAAIVDAGSHDVQSNPWSQNARAAREPLVAAGTALFGLASGEFPLQGRRIRDPTSTAEAVAARQRPESAVGLQTMAQRRRILGDRTRLHSEEFP